MKKKEHEMELKDFIKESLVQINMAIIESNEMLKDTEAIINPGCVQINSDKSQAFGRQSYKADHDELKVVHKIDFDVAVSVQDDQKAGGGAKISIVALKLGADAEVKYSNQSVSKIKFSIPVIYPESDKKWFNKHNNNE